MFTLQFEKQQLTNLEYGLSRELIRASRSGSFACTTIIGCNTRKYHGLLICPQPAIDGGNHVLLSAIDETVIQHDAEFNLGIRQYPGGVYNPKGHKYITGFTADPIPCITYRVGGVLLSKEILFVENEDRVLIRYTLLEAHSPTRIRFRPFLAFRNVHSLSKANVSADRKYQEIDNGIRLRMYTGYDYLHLQFSDKLEYVHTPDWYYNVEYLEEARRGYECQEDLFVPGYFEGEIKKGESIIFSAGTTDKRTGTLHRAFNWEIRKRTPRNSFTNCLINSAEQFIVKKGRKTEVVAGYPWFGRWARDTFISLPGLTLTLDKPQVCKAVMDSLLDDLNGPLFPNMGDENNAPLNSADAPLWFLWTLQQYTKYVGGPAKTWKEYHRKIKQILDGYRHGTHFDIHMTPECLIYCGVPGTSVTWMDAVVAGKPVTPRIGLPIEINALWYNGIMFSLEMAEEAGDNEFIEDWKPIAEKIDETFKPTFWEKDRGYLADYVNGEYKNWSVRPNQIFVASLPYSPLSEQIRKLVVDICKTELLTPRGLRTLSPKDPEYKGTYGGSQAERDAAYHQGTVWPWLLGHYAEASLRIDGKAALSSINKLFEGFVTEMTEHGICSISEIYEGDPPHRADGAISQAWSVAEILRMEKLIEEYSK
ncbi:MAG: amylo-alpha-1,6-glucosidase [Bacteroidota bacterium]